MTPKLIEVTINIDGKSTQLSPGLSRLLVEHGLGSVRRNLRVEIDNAEPGAVNTDLKSMAIEASDVSDALQR